MSQTYEIRDQIKIYLIGDDLNQILRQYDPFNKKTLVFWEKARVPTGDNPRYIDELEYLHNEWRGT